MTAYDDEAPATCPVGRSHAAFEHAGMYEFLADARKNSPVFFNQEIGYWVVTRYQDVLSILGDPATFSAAVALEPVCPFPDELKGKLATLNFTPEKVHVDCDPPKHTRIRQIAGQYLGMRHFKPIEEQIRCIIREYIGGMVREDEVDLVNSLTYEFPARVIFLLLGEQDVDPAKLKAWGDNRLALVWGKLDRSDQIAAAGQLADFWHFSGELVKARLQQPGRDYPSYLLDKRAGDDATLSLNEIQSMLFALLFAGHETTTNAAGNLIYNLLKRRGQWQMLVDKPSKIPLAVEEGLRMATSVVAWRRVTTHATTIGGVEVPQGSRILISLASANHDETMFSDGETFDMDRPNIRKHLSFGNGTHFCLGGPLARIELKILLEELVTTFPDMKLVESQDLTWTRTISFRGPEKLFVRLR